MAANSFATKLSRNTNRITVILVYAFLEWLLMFFIFLNSLFTFFIVKFASFFGLKQVCLLCPNLDRILGQNPQDRLTYRELLCQNHVAELASLSFCKTHGKLSESVNLCSDCSDREERSSIGSGFCVCCEKSLGDKPYSSNYLLIKSSIWGKTLCDRENGGLILEMIDDDKFGDGFEIERESDRFFFREKAKEEQGKRPEQQQNGEVISDAESYGLSLREVSEEDGLRSVIGNNLIGNEEDEIPEAKSRVSEDDTSNVATYGEDKIAVRLEEEEDQEETDLLDNQFRSKNFICKLNNEPFVIENLSVGFDPLLSGTQNEEAEQEEKTNNELLETPTSVKTLLHKNLFLSRNGYAAVEEALDGNVAPIEIDSDDPSRTIERLRETVKAEQEALRGLYAELEEERSASAIAANQTMAMITRLQEEKAKVQMEALQYQRMMEEQAEYDQEALQLLNHLMVKREKEKEELQRQLEVYKEKVLEYESKAKNKNTTTRIDCNSKADDKKEENGEEEDVDLEKITLDCVTHMSMLDDSLSEFEEERLVILDQLKVLEDRLLTIQDKESAEDTKFPGEFSNSYEEESDENEGLTMASMAKSLLPLLDAAENESEDGFQEVPESVKSNFGSESEKLEIIKQVDSVYERLQELETDGEKGTDLLQDILQHLRDLRTIKLSETLENQTRQDE